MSMQRYISVPMILAGLILAAGTVQAQCALPHSFANGQTADATQVMANFNALLTCLNPGGSTNSVQYNTGGGVPGGLGPLTDGQLIVGSTGGAPQAQNLTAGTGISITNGPGNVTIAATGGVGLAGLYRQVMSSTPTAASTGLANWVNQGGAAVSDTATGVAIDAPPSGTTVANIAGRYGAAPTAPYTIKVLIGATRSSSNYSAVGIGWYDGTNKIHVMDMATSNGGANFLEVTQWNSPTSLATTSFVTPVNAFAQPIWMQIADDGTNISFAFSQDGANFLPLLSVAKASGFLGASGYSNIIFIVNPRGGTRTLGTLMSWTQS
jgi:hypothetical protein